MYSLMSFQEGGEKPSNDRVDVHLADCQSCTSLEVVRNAKSSATSKHAPYSKSQIQDGPTSVASEAAWQGAGSMHHGNRLTMPVCKAQSNRKPKRPQV